MQQTMQVGLGLEPTYGTFGGYPQMNYQQPMYNQQAQPTYQQNQVPNQQPQQQKSYNIDPSIINMPPTRVIGSGQGTIKPRFTIVDEGKSDPNHSIAITPAMMPTNEEKKAGRPKKKKKPDAETGIMKVDDKPLTGTVEDPATIYTYNETNQLLHETLGQIDSINRELIQEFNAVRNSRTMKNKYMTLNNLSENIGSLINNRIQTIKEINNCISKSNDLDYKKYKDMQAAMSNVNDDKYIADIYQALIQNPSNMAPSYTANVDPALVGSGIIRANLPGNMDMTNGQVIDSGYLNYISNLSPEQNLMRYEDDPNVKQVLVYDESTGNRFFQIMNMSTGEVIPNVPTYGEAILAETTLDIDKGIAKNLNIRESFPIVKINSNPVTSQY